VPVAPGDRNREGTDLNGELSRLSEIGQRLPFQFGNKLFVIRSLSTSFGISVLSGVLPVVQRSHGLLVVCTDRSELSIACEAAPNFEFALREAGH
jgi:hypothetical protein